jgi:hypothetical protein
MGHLNLTNTSAEASDMSDVMANDLGPHDKLMASN